MQKRLLAVMLGLGWTVGVGAADCVHSPWGPEDQIGAANRVKIGRAHV